MNYRTDVRYENGQIRVAEPKHTADTSKPLPKVEGTDRLQSAAWGDVWRKEAGVGDNAIESLASAQAEISRAFKGFVEIREQQHPDHTQSLHLKTLAQDYERALNRLAGQTDRAAERANARLAEIDSQFKEYVGWNASDAQELRSVIRGMDEKARSKFLSDAIEAGDGQALAAVLGAHPSLSGLTADMQTAYRARAMQLHTPKLLNLERTIKKARDMTREAFLDFLERGDVVTAKKLREEYAAKEKAAYEARKRASEGSHWGGV